jgi:hypothetical protein
LYRSNRIPQQFFENWGLGLYNLYLMSDGKPFNWGEYREAEFANLPRNPYQDPDERIIDCVEQITLLASIGLSEIPRHVKVGIIARRAINRHIEATGENLCSALASTSELGLAEYRKRHNYDQFRLRSELTSANAQFIRSSDTTHEHGGSPWATRVRRHIGYAAASLSVGALGVLAPGIRRNFEHAFDKPKPEPYTGIFSRHTPFDR